MIDRFVLVTLAAFLGSFLFATEATSAATIIGKLVTPSIVWVTDEKALHPVVAEMRNTGKMFVPTILAVPIGSTVRFPNDDPFFHSIFSGSETGAFDIGFYPAGPGKEQLFERTGVLDVRCHIHALMRANIVVVDGPFATADMTFSIADIGPGERIVHAWSRERGLRSASVRVVGPEATVVLAGTL